MSIILRSPEEPQLDRATFQRVQRASVAYEEYKHYRAELSKPEDDEGPGNDDAWLFEDLHVFLRNLTKTRDKEQMIELIFEVRAVVRYARPLRVLTDLNGYREVLQRYSKI